MDYELLKYDRLQIIKTIIEKYEEENFYVSFSGGKDSTVLHHLIDEAIPNNNIPRVFINTGIEYRFIQEFVKDMAKTDNRICEVNSGVNIPTMLREKGYPFKSKGHSHKVALFQHGSNAPTVIEYARGGEFNCPKILQYQFKKNYDLKISDRCCYELKKNVIKRYEKENNRHVAILGLRLGEGGQRANHQGCVVFDKGGLLTRFKPLNPLNDDWIEWYVKEKNIKLCKLYYPPYNFNRTGCKGCPYSIHLQEHLEVMARLLPNERKQCEILWKPIYEEYRRIGYRLKKYEQSKLF